MVPGKKYRSNSTNPSTSSFGPGDLIDCLSFPAVTLSLSLSLFFALSFPLSLRLVCTGILAHIKRRSRSILCPSLFGPHWNRYTGIFFFPLLSPLSFSLPPFLSSISLPPSLSHSFSKTLILPTFLSFLLFPSLGGSKSYRRRRLTTGDLRVRLTLPRVRRNGEAIYVIKEQEG